MKPNSLSLLTTLFLIVIAGNVAAEDKAPIQKPIIKLTTSEWPPYISQKLKGNGYMYQVVVTIFKNGGYEPDVEFMSWKDSLKLDQLQKDAIFPLYKASDPHFVCSKYFYGGSVGFFKRKGDVLSYTVADPSRNQAQAFQGLNDKRFGVVDGYNNTPEFDAADLQKILAKDDYSNLKNLADGKTDLAFTDVFVAEYLVDQHPELANIEFMGPSLANQPIQVCFSSNAPDYKKKLEDFNRELDKMRDRGDFEKIMSEYGY